MTSSIPPMAHGRSASLSPPWLRWALVVTAVAAAGVSLLLTFGSLAGQAGQAFSKICGALGGGDCSGALSSRWAYVGPFPAALLGFSYFAFVALWYGVAGLANAAGRGRHGLIFAVVLLGVAISACYVWVMFARLPVWCPLCAVAHGLNLLLLIGTWWAVPRRGTPDPAGEARPATIRIAGVVLGALLAAGSAFGALSAVYYAQVAAHARGALLEATNNADYVVWRHQSAARVELPLRADDAGAGPGDAPHVLVAFMDFQCPHCREFEAYGNRVLRWTAGRLRIVFRHYPMSRECSARIPPKQDIHPHACRAALAFEAAWRAAPGEPAWRYRDQLFHRQAELGGDPWESIASDVGIDVARFAAMLNDPATRQRVVEDVGLARRLDLEGAGSMFLDGRRLYSWRITTDDYPPRVDEARTAELWRRLVGLDGAEATTRPN